MQPDFRQFLVSPERTIHSFLTSIDAVTVVHHRTAM